MAGDGERGRAAFGCRQRAPPGAGFAPQRSARLRINRRFSVAHIVTVRHVTVQHVTLHLVTVQLTERGAK